jgi:hypothetical protein
MAVELIAMRSPMSTVSIKPNPNKEQTAYNIASVAPTWTDPPRIMLLLISRNSFKEKSMPTVKRRRTIPSSATNPTSEEPLISSKPCGPARMPVSMNAIMAGAFSHKNTKMTAVISPRTMMMSTSNLVSIATPNSSSIRLLPQLIHSKFIIEVWFYIEIVGQFLVFEIRCTM